MPAALESQAARGCFPGRLRLSKKWLAPLFRGLHSSLAPTARPGSYAGKPLLRKAFCGFAVHAAKSDYSLRGGKAERRLRRVFHRRQKGNTKPGPTLYGAGQPIHGRKRRGNGPAPWGKAAAHALRAAAASSACRGILSSDNLTRCCATIAVRVAPPSA